MTASLLVEIFFLCLAIIPPVMVLLYRTRPVPWGTLRYGLALRLFALFFAVCVLAFGVGFTTSAIKTPSTEIDQWAWPLLALAAFAPVAAWLVGDTFFIRHRFDAVGIYYRSPWSPHRHLLWSDVTSVRWGAASQRVTLVDTRDRVFHFAGMLAGLDAFAKAALTELPPEVTARHPREMKVLEALVEGRAVQLSGMNRL